MQDRQLCIVQRTPLGRHVAVYLYLTRHPSTRHVASLRLCSDVFHQLGTSSPDPIVNGQLPRALPRLQNAFQIGSLTIFCRQSFFLLPKARLMGHPYVFLGDLLRFALCRLQSKVTSETPSRPTNNLYQSPKE